MVFPFIPPSVFSHLSSLFHPYVELRQRYERHINPEFDGPAQQNRDDLYTRLRLGANLTFSDSFTGRVEYQKLSDVFWTHKANGSTQNSDATLANLQYNKDAYSFIGGRQRIALGQQRLLGYSDWSNISRSWDAGQVGAGQWLAWFGRLGVADPEPATARVGDLTHTDKTFGTTSFIFKHDVGNVANIDIGTLDHLATVKFGRTSLDGEAVLQGGANNGRNQQAWMWHARATQELFAKTSLSIEANAASGGGDHEISRTPDSLYPSKHDQYGFADTTGWKNMTEVQLKLVNKPSDTWSFRASAEAFWLRDPSDAWYSAAGSANPRPGGGIMEDPTGASGRSLGDEYDLVAAYSVGKFDTISAGVCLFKPGHFVDHLTGHADNMTFLYALYQVKF